MVTLKTVCINAFCVTDNASLRSNEATSETEAPEPLRRQLHRKAANSINKHFLYNCFYLMDCRSINCSKSFYETSFIDCADLV